MSKASDLISSEHRQVEALFERFLRDPERSTAMELCALLERHTEMEELVLYPELRAVDESGYRDATEEHEEADQLIQQIRMSHNLDQLTGLVRKLEQSVSHHVDDEEAEHLPKLQRACGTARMDELGERMQQWKLTRVPADGSPMASDAPTAGHDRTASGQDGSGATGADKDVLLDLTKDELYEKAKEADIPGRSTMNKDELAEELAKL